MATGSTCFPSTLNSYCCRRPHAQALYSSDPYLIEFFSYFHLGVFGIIGVAFGKPVTIRFLMPIMDG